LIPSNFEQTLRHLSRRYRAGIKTETTKRDVEKRTGAKGSLETLPFADEGIACASCHRSPFFTSDFTGFPAISDD
jgi:hypothetical protein